jgi:U4/U6.U5 tri-snRNP-associated protein 2
MTSTNSTACPYLDTINRTHLDFDFSPHCSSTLESSPHIYACLVCGKFFRGKGRQTPAYTHSVEEGHFVFVHLSNGTFWCLPDGYEISTKEEPSLSDISLALNPSFTSEEVGRLDDNQELARDLFGRRYLPGFVGLNNLNKTDYLNCVVQALAHVRPLRDFFLLAGSQVGTGGIVAAADGSSDNNPKKKRKTSHQPLSYANFSPLAKAFSLLLRNMWSSHRFKSNVDPHMLVQAVSVASNKRYHVGKQAEAGDFLAWLLHQLHVGIGGSVGKKKRSSGGSTVIHQTFMGKVEVTTFIKKRRKRGEEAALEMMNGGNMSTDTNDATADDVLGDEDDRAGSDDEETVARKQLKRETLTSLASETVIVEESTVTETDFLQLTLDIPEKPLFKDADGGLVIPQEPLVNVLRKFDGVSFCDALALQKSEEASANSTVDGGSVVVSKKRRYRLKKLPNYLILHLSRFKHNNFTVEKNPTIVMFPVKNFDLSSYLFPEGGREKVPTEEEVRGMSVSCLFWHCLKLDVMASMHCSPNSSTAYSPLDTDQRAKESIDQTRSQRPSQKCN